LTCTFDAVQGILPNFSDLAVNRLNMEIGLVELNNEVKMLARLDHPNIIRMLGSCIGNNGNMMKSLSMDVNLLGLAPSPVLLPLWSGWTECSVL